MVSHAAIADLEVPFRAARPLEQSAYPGFSERRYVLKQGSVQAPGAMPLACDVLVEQDVPVVLRDGTTIRTDIFRPVDRHDCPAIMGWAPYGKRGGALNLDFFGHPTRMDVPRAWEDGLNLFEGPNPSYWVAHGYAVAQPDPRGVFNSEGDILAWGAAGADDCHDMIEWLATREWSNGKVGLCGNSWLAMSQYFVAATRPPHLAAIAPWEGASDVYRDTAARGGIPDRAFCDAIFSGMVGNNAVEDMPRMLREHPLFGPYWQDKRARLDGVDIPAYFAASWTNHLHTNGTFAAFEEIGSKDKWLRVHNTMEWPDSYAPANVEDLRRFFDFHLKGVDNGWLDTPRIRLSILDPGHEDIGNRAESEFPLARQQVRELFLTDTNGTLGLSPDPQAGPSHALYDPLLDEGLVFPIVFDEAVELTGYFNLRLWVEARGHDDMDIFAYIRKRDALGVLQETAPVTGRTHIGPNGRLRVSMRAIDPARSSRLRPFLPLEQSQPLQAGEIVAVEIGFWPYGIRWHAGETLELLITGRDLVVRPEFPDMPGAATLNKGQHIVHLGGKFASSLLVPLVPSSHSG